MERQGMLTTEELEVLSRSGEIDTVLCMFTDLQGRFMGKRVLPDFFIEEILGEEGLHACLYLLAIDMEMEPLAGYEYASWETGYGDFRMVPDVSTLRDVPVAGEDRDGDLRHRRRGGRLARQRLAPADPEGSVAKSPRWATR
jgi:glutamine synthetase